MTISTRNNWGYFSGAVKRSSFHVRTTLGFCLRYITVKNYSIFYNVLLLYCYSERLFPQFTVNCCYFFTFIFVKYCVFYSVKCKMLRYIVKNIMKYRDFFNRQIRASILPTKYCNFFFYSKPVIFLQETVNKQNTAFYKNIYNILLIFDSDKL